MYRGDIALGSTIDIKFTTRRFSTGAPFTLAGTPAISAYVDNGTIEITAGITLTVDFDARTGLNNIRIVATSGNGYAAGTNVDLVITAGTVDSVSVVGEVVGSFSIENRSAVRPTTAGRTLTVESDGMAHADVKEWLGIAPLALSAQQVQAIVPNTQKVDVETIKTQAVTLAGGVTIPAATLASTTNITAGTITTTTNLTNLPSIPANWITAAGITDGAFTAAKFAAGAFDAVWTVAVRTLTAFDASFKTGYALSAAGVQAIWDALTAALITVGSIGKLLVDNVNATISSRASQASVDAVQADTDDIQTRLPAALVGGRMASNAEVVGDKTGYALSAAGNNAVADALLDRADAVEVGLTPRQEMRLTAAASAGKLSGAATTTMAIRNAVADSKARITATVDADGNRTAVTTDVT